MPNHTSLYSNNSYTSLLVPASRSADANSTGLDLQDCDDVALLFYIGASGDTINSSNYIELEVQESDDNSTFTAVANADLTNYVTGTNVGTAVKVDAGGKLSTVHVVGYRGSKRYIRGVLNYTGTHSVGTLTSILSVRGRNRAQPVNALT